MRSRTMMLAAVLLLPTAVQAQVINGESTYESNLQKRPPVELEDSALVRRPEARSDADDAAVERERRPSLYPSR